jgi:hypothetical protein
VKGQRGREGHRGLWKIICAPAALEGGGEEPGHLAHSLSRWGLVTPGPGSDRPPPKEGGGARRRAGPKARVGQITAGGPRGLSLALLTPTRLDGTRDLHPRPHKSPWVLPGHPSPEAHTQPLPGIGLRAAVWAAAGMTFVQHGATGCCCCACCCYRRSGGGFFVTGVSSAFPLPESVCACAVSGHAAIASWTTGLLGPPPPPPKVRGEEKNRIIFSKLSLFYF